MQGCSRSGQLGVRAAGAMGLSPDAENDPPQKQLQLVVEVPKHARPGVTKLAVDVDEGSELHVLVPAEAVAGDRLRLTKMPDGPWTCVVLRSQPLYDVANRILQSPGDQCKLQLLVPANVKPGETKLQVTISADEQVQLAVPNYASPGDLIELHRADGEPWLAKFTRDRYTTSQDPQKGLAVMAELGKTSSEAGVDADALVDRLFTVAKEAGCFVSPKIKRGCAPPLNIPGLVAVEAIEEGEELIRVPSRFHLTPPTVETSAPALAAAVQACSMPAQRRGEALHAFFLARLLADAQERVVNAAGRSVLDGKWSATADQKKVWEAYADALLAEDFSYHPFRLAACKPEEMRENLSPSQEAEYFIDMAADLMSLHETMQRCEADAYAEDAEALPPLEAEMFLRARMCAQTRVFQTCVDTTLVPVADLLNHSPTLTPGVLWGWDAEAQAMIITAVRAHSPGEELLTTYGARSNMLVYRTYGFTLHPKNEPSFTYIIRPHLVRPVLKIFMDNEEARPLMLLETSHIDDSLCQAGLPGSAWLEQNGAGPAGDRQALATALTAELQAKGFPPAAVAKQVSHFLESGRVSASNLDRLMRRMERSVDKASPSLSARGSEAPVDIRELARWSKVAAIQKQRMEDEERAQRFIDQQRKSRYRDFLKDQVERREKKKEEEQEEKVKDRAWADQRKEQMQVEEVARKSQRQEQMFRLKDEIMSQVSTVRSRKLEQKSAEVLRAQEDNKRAQRQLELDKVEALKKKEVRRLMDQAQAQAWAEERQQQLEEKEREAEFRATERRRKQEEADIQRREGRERVEKAQMERSLFFEKLHLKNQAGARTDRLHRRNERIQQELRALAPLRAAAQRCEEEEQEKQASRSRKRRENVEFLNQQMKEKEERQRKDLEFEEQKLKEQQELAARKAELDSERQQEVQRRRARYKAELLDQMAKKIAKGGQMVSEDVMSDMEMALNKEMLQELSLYAWLAFQIRFAAKEFWSIRLRDGHGILNQVTKKGRDATEFLRLLCARSRWAYDQDERIRPCLRALAKAREEQPGSHDWWSHMEEEHKDLVNQDVVRVIMSEYLCLTAHLEAVDYADEHRADSECLSGCQAWRKSLAKALGLLKTAGGFSLSTAKAESPK
ncbi:unnamed protein product [Effrenium voratum]|nr:unnamed protein product [Effrenium voratum]